MNSDSDSDCIITDCKEGEDCIIVTDISSPEMCKLEPEENWHCKLILGDGRCIDNGFAVHLEENLDVGILGKLGTKFPINFQSTDNFLNAGQEKIYNNITMKQYNNNTADMCVCEYLLG